MKGKITFLAQACEQTTTALVIETINFIVTGSSSPENTFLETSTV